MEKLFGQLVKCSHCTGWIDLRVQEFAWERFDNDDLFYHTYCWLEIYGRPAAGENRGNEG
jgi:hypothetical protein